MTPDRETEVMRLIEERSQTHVRELRDAYVELKQLHADTIVEMETAHAETRAELLAERTSSFYAERHGAVKMRDAFLGFLLLSSENTRDRLNTWRNEDVEALTSALNSGDFTRLRGWK